MGTKLGGDRTPAQKSFAYGLDVKSTKLSVGTKYVSFRWTFTDLRQGTNLRATAGLSSRGVKTSGVKVLGVTIFADAVKAWTNAPHGHDNFLCGEPGAGVLGDPVGTVPAGAPQVKTTVKYGKNGYVYARFLRKCINVGSANAPVRASSIVTSAQPGLGGTFVDFVSSKKVRTAELTSYVKY